MTSPVFYILVALAGMSAMISVIFFMAWFTLGRKPYAMSWALAFLAATLQWVINLSAPLFPSHEVFWISVNAMALILITLGLRGHCQRTNCTHLPANLWPYSAAVLAVIAWATVVQPHVGIRTTMVPACAALTLFLAGLMIYRHREEPRPAEIAAAVTMILFAGIQTIAAGMAFMQGADGNDAYRALYMHFNFLTLPAGYTGMAMFVIFMLASDLSEEMKAIAVRDQLTGLLNRRGFNEQSAKTYSLARRRDLPVAVILADIDKFKRINDEYGHEAGDEALQHFSRLLQVSRRHEDVLARVGGEEFALILPGTRLDDAIKIASMLRSRVEIAPLNYKGERVSMTASFGVATLSETDTRMTEVIVRADTALYRSKRDGRNRVELESSQILESNNGTLRVVSA
ncbi:MAG: GGDEF domain-containing protein [Pseudomonadota bacterium]